MNDSKENMLHTTAVDNTKRFNSYSPLSCCDDPCLGCFKL